MSSGSRNSRSSGKLLVPSGFGVGSGTMFVSPGESRSIRGSPAKSSSKVYVLSDKPLICFEVSASSRSGGKKMVFGKVSVSRTIPGGGSLNMGITLWPSPLSLSGKVSAPSGKLFVPSREKVFVSPESRSGGVPVKKVSSESSVSSGENMISSGSSVGFIKSVF